MDHPSGTVTRLLPDAHVEEYQTLSPLRREDMVQIAFTALQDGRTEEEAADALHDAGIGKALAAWYVPEVWQARAPVAPYSERLVFGKEAEPQATPASHLAPILLSATGCVLTLAGVTALFFNPTFFGPHNLEVAATLIILAFKASQMTLAYHLALTQGKRGPYFAALTLPLGWFAIFYLLLSKLWEKLNAKRSAS